MALALKLPNGFRYHRKLITFIEILIKINAETIYYGQKLTSGPFGFNTQE